MTLTPEERNMTLEEFAFRHSPFIHKPREEWTDDERTEFNAIMDAVMTYRAMVIHDDIITRRKERKE